MPAVAPEQVDVDGVLERRRVDREDRVRWRCDPRIGDHHVDPAKALCAAVGRAPQRVEVGDVGLQGGGTVLAELGAQRLQRLPAPPDERDPGAFGVGLAGKLRAQAARSARNEDDTTVKWLAPVAEYGGAEGRDRRGLSCRGLDQSGGGGQQHVALSPARTGSGYRLKHGRCAISMWSRRRPIESA
jgi:hypothetical protein